MTEEEWENKALNYWADKKGMNEITLVKNPALEITIDSALVVEKERAENGIRF